MPYILDNLSIDRVDFVDEGANSAAFIEICKRKENAEPMDFSEILSKMKPEHASVVQAQLDEVSAELAKVKGDLEQANITISEQADKLATANSELETLKAKPATTEEPDEEEVLKAMPENIRAEFIKMRAQRDAAEEQVRKDAEEKREAEAVAKANTLKSLPVSQDVLVGIIKNCDASVVDVLTAAANAIDTAVLGEVGKAAPGAADKEAWEKIEEEADKVCARDGVTKQKAITIVLKEKPELYREYLNGGAN